MSAELLFQSETQFSWLNKVHILEWGQFERTELLEDVIFEIS